MKGGGAKALERDLYLVRIEWGVRIRFIGKVQLASQ